MLRHYVLTLVAIAGFSLGVPHSCAQSALLDLPRDSQHATIMQRIGITDITINYHRPEIKGRQIFGKLVPYGEVWRAGANENTTISLTDPVSIEGKPLAKGTYGLHMIPGENEWTIIFSKIHTAWGSFTYNESQDALRVKVKPEPAEMHEALTYDFDDVKENSAVATLRWNKIAVPFKIEVNVHDIVQESLPNQLQGLAQYTWEGWDDAANYLLAQKYALDAALKYEDASIQNEKRYENLMTKSQIIDAMGKKDEAESTKKDALGLASASQLYTYGRQLQAQGKQDQAFDAFRQASKKDPNDWLAHAGNARIYSSQGDFDDAVKEMKLCQAAAPDNQKNSIANYIKKLEAKQDINKK